MVYVRKNIWGLETPNPWDPVTTAYAQGVALMRTRQPTDPTSWAYQAAMHGTFAAVPPGADWNQCQHGTWYFVAWHRMYLYWFERIVRAAAKQAGSPIWATWTLPYWNYSAGAPANQLPPAFRQPTWTPPGGGGPVANPLYTAARNVRAGHNINQGAALPPQVTDFSWAYSFRNFTGSPTPGFGGPVTGFSHDSGNFGALEMRPHNVIHTNVGGDATYTDCSIGWMSDPRCAAQDPIFWLHHANIDRLWTNWIALGGGRADPNDPRWLAFDFTFYDENKTKQQMKPRQVLDTLKQLGYIYDDHPGPALNVSKLTLARQQPMLPQPPEPPGPPMLVAATEQGVDLAAGRTDVSVSLPSKARDAIASAVERPEGHVYLHVEGLESDRIPGLAYEVHVNLPAGADLETEAHDSMVGMISFFGFGRDSKATEDNPNHPLGPMAHTFDITGRVYQLRDEGTWNDEQVEVSFVPVGLLPEPGVEGTAHDVETDAKPRIGRVSISYQ